MLLNGLLKNDRFSNSLKQAQFLNNTIPIFTQFGQNIYASDVVQMCIDCIATECSKLQPKHIRRDKNGKLINLKGDSINALLSSKPNPLMITRDFIEKTIWTLFLNYNAFIYPAYETVNINGTPTRNYTGFYPLNPSKTDWLQDESDTLFVRFTFQNNKTVTLPYEDVIHLRKKYSLNDIMGGGISGGPDNQALLSVLQTNDTLLQGMEKAIKLSLGIRGIIKINGLLDDNDQKTERDAFIKQLNDGLGVVTQDFKGDYTPLEINPKIIDKETLEFLNNKILRWFGVSLPILNGNYTDEEYQAFYNKSLEPIVIGLNQGFTSTVFSLNQRSYNHEIIFYQQKLELMSIKNKLAILEGLGNRGALTNNELLDIFGIEPYEGGDVRMASLNYINIDIADKYQLARAGIDSQVPNTNQNSK